MFRTMLISRLRLAPEMRVVTAEQNVLMGHRLRGPVRYVAGLRIVGILLALVLLPQSAYASVYISEVAWMGTSVSANDEWLELHNDGSGAVSLADWRITDGVNFDVTLAGAGSVAAGTFAVLERTDDSSVSGTAFYIYTGSLPNSGATLRLYDANGNLVDQVAGGENWENIGGDNTTKNTAQYSTKGWLTAAPTPGRVNATEAAATTDTTGDTTNQPAHTTSGSSGASARRSTESTSAAKAPFNATIVAPSRGFVAQPIEFQATISGRGADSRVGRELTWNFGDTYTDTGSEVTHQYYYPGTYIVSLRGRYKGEEIHLRQEITVLPVQLAITRNRDGAVQISNTAPYELALGGYLVTAPAGSYTLPEDTYLKANATITVPPSVLAAAPEGVVAVHDQTAQVVTYQLPSWAKTPISVTAPAVAAVTNAVPPRMVAAAPPPASTFTFSNSALYPATASATTDQAAAGAAAPAAAIEAIPTAITTQSNGMLHNRLAYVGLVGLLLLAIFALLLYRQRDPEADSYKY